MIGFTEFYEGSKDGFCDFHFDGSEKIDDVVNLLSDQNLWQKDEISFNLYRKDLRRLKIKHIDYDKQLELIKRYKSGDMEAKLKLFYHMLPAIINIARKYQNQGLLLNDLISEGNIGIWNNIHKLEDRGYTLYTFAGAYGQIIKTAIAKYYNIIHYPTNIITLSWKLQKYINFHLASTGEYPSNDEIAEDNGISITSVIESVNVVNKHISLDAYREFFDDEDVYDEAVNKFYSQDLYYNLSYDDGYVDIFHQHSLKIEIKETLKQLDKRQRAILIMFFGLYGYPELTLEEIARKFNLTRERVRQIKEAALKKLRMIEDGQLRMFLG